MDNYGNCIEVHLTESGFLDFNSKHYYLVGTVNTSEQTINWGTSLVYDKGDNLTIAMDNKGNCIEVHKSENNKDHFYMVGRLSVFTQED